MALLMSSKTKTGRELVEGMSSSGCVRDAALKILYLPRQQSLCAISEYFRLIKTYLILTPCQITPLWVWFNHLTVFYCTDCHKKIKKKQDKHNVPLRAVQARLVEWTSFWSRRWTKTLMEGGWRQIGLFCWGKMGLLTEQKARVSNGLYISSRCLIRFD